MNTSAAVTTARLGRRCVLCSHPDRALIEYELSSGEYSLRGISRRHDLVAESVRRHVRGHVADSVRSAMNEVAGTPALSIAARLLDVADSARDARLAAEEDGNSKLAASMGIAEARTLSSLVAMGVVDGDIAAAIHDAEDALQVLGTVVRDHSDVTAAILDTLERRGRIAWANKIRQLADSNNETREVSANEH